LDLISTYDPTFKINIERRIEPNSLEVFDIAQYNTLDDNGLSSEMYILSARGDEFFFD
jgi:hypothetical protein